jgi:hypothetical protein
MTNFIYVVILVTIFSETFKENIERINEPENVLTIDIFMQCHSPSRVTPDCEVYCQGNNTNLFYNINEIKDPIQ